VSVKSQPSATRPPIIDMHMHAMPVDFYGKPPAKACAPQNFPWADPRNPDDEFLTCAGASVESATMDEENIRRTVALMEQYNVTGVVSAPVRGGISPIDRLKPWQQAAPNRIIPGVWTNGQARLDQLRAWAKDGSLRVLGELTFQYTGYSFSDALPEQHFALAEEFDLPVGLHVGPGAPGEAYFLSARYRASLGNPLSLEEPLLRHPKMRLYVMHAGWPFIDEMIALLFYHPQVNVDVGIISWQLPRPEFHRYLRRFIDAGFGKRVMRVRSAGVPRHDSRRDREYRISRLSLGGAEARRLLQQCRALPAAGSKEVIELARGVDGCVRRTRC
jgi:predicted TIM-barrel fold metal-dependent hydrolase